MANYTIDKKPVNRETLIVSIITRIALALIGIGMIATGLGVSYVTVLYVVLGVALVKSGVIVTISDK
jgi:hypothetical protein